jgi:(p)ppGpp synthase/HD superfamily hydrolase
MPTANDVALLTARFDEALTLASRIHAGDERKGTRIPYIAHLLGVCALILADGGDEDEAIAGLLHDTLEDHPDQLSRSELESRFGARVRRIVEGCTDTPADYRGGPKPPWRERKLGYLEHLRHAGPDALRVSLADKLDNARAIVADYRIEGEALWSRFSAGRGDQLWYYRSLVEVIGAAGPPGRLLGQLEAQVTELEALVADETMKQTANARFAIRSWDEKAYSEVRTCPG